MCVSLSLAGDCDAFLVSVSFLRYKVHCVLFQVQHGEELEQLKRDMAVVLQASLGAVASPAKDDSNVQQLKQRIKELEDETEELSRKYNEELKSERVRSTTRAEAKSRSLV